MKEWKSKRKEETMNEKMEKKNLSKTCDVR